MSEWLDLVDLSLLGALNEFTPTSIRKLAKTARLDGRRTHQRLLNLKKIGNVRQIRKMNGRPSEWCRTVDGRAIVLAYLRRYNSEAQQRAREAIILEPGRLDVAVRLAKSSMATYPERIARIALRCALGDAAALCDALSTDILNDHKGRSGKGAVTKLGNALAAVAKQCGDAIFTMREMIKVEADG